MLSDKTYVYVVSGPSHGAVHIYQTEHCFIPLASTCLLIDIVIVLFLKDLLSGQSSFILYSKPFPDLIVSYSLGHQSFTGGRQIQTSFLP